jgi:hypothetical protein
MCSYLVQEKYGGGVRMSTETFSVSPACWTLIGMSVPSAVVWDKIVEFRIFLVVVPVYRTGLLWFKKYIYIYLDF